MKNLSIFLLAAPLTLTAALLDGGPNPCMAGPNPCIAALLDGVGLGGGVASEAFVLGVVAARAVGVSNGATIA